MLYTHTDLYPLSLSGHRIRPGLPFPQVFPVLGSPFSAGADPCGFIIHKLIQESGIGQCWRPEFSSARRAAPKQALLTNRADAGGWKGRDANEAKNRFLTQFVYKGVQ
jgi:hypothetical protein